MLKDKVTKIFDVDVFKHGSLITVRQWNVGDNGDYMEPGPLLNGVIISCSETEVQFATTEGLAILRINELKENGGKRFTVLGVMGALQNFTPPYYTPEGGEGNV
jgi:hypothetical protein